MVGANNDEALADLGLTPDESRAYRALLQHGQLGATELAEAAGVSRGRIYEVVAGLLRKGVATELASATRLFAAADPLAAVDNLLSGRREELRRLEATAQRTVRDLTELAKAAGPASLVELIRHRATVAQRFQALEEAAKEEILLITKRPIIIAHEANSPEIDAMRRGVRVRCLYESVMLDDPAERSAILRYVRAGEDARHAAILPAKLAIFDRSVTLLLLDDPSDPESMATVVIRHPGVAGLGVAAFEQVWGIATPIPADELTGAAER